jgi:hypothetical protein
MGMSLVLAQEVSTIDPLVKRNKSATVNFVTGISSVSLQGNHPNSSNDAVAASLFCGSVAFPNSSGARWTAASMSIVPNLLLGGE